MYSQKGCSISRGMEMTKSRNAGKQSAWAVSVMRSTAVFKCDKSHNLRCISCWVKEFIYFFGGGGGGVSFIDLIVHGKDTPTGILQIQQCEV